MIYKLYSAPIDYSRPPYATARTIDNARKRAIEEGYRTYIIREGEGTSRLCGIVDKVKDGLFYYNNLEKKVHVYLKKDGSTFTYR